MPDDPTPTAIAEQPATKPAKVIEFREVEMPEHIQAAISHALKYGRASHYTPMDPAPPQKPR